MKNILLVLAISFISACSSEPARPNNNRVATTASVQSSCMACRNYCHQLTMKVFSCQAASVPFPSADACLCGE